MIYLGSERIITQDFTTHKTAEDYCGDHLSAIKIMGRAKVINVVNKYKAYDDTINYNDFLNNASSWRMDSGYQCVSITGKSIFYEGNELGGNMVTLEGYIGNKYYQYMVCHLADVFVKVGDIVDSDTIIGLQGNTGLVLSGKSRNNQTYGSHVHFEVKDQNNLNINPREYAIGNHIITYSIDDKKANSDDNKYIFIYQCLKDDIYYLRLKKNEKLFIMKD